MATNMNDRITEIKARLFDIQYHNCNGRASTGQFEENTGCTLCEEYHRLLGELQRWGLDDQRPVVMPKAAREYNE